MSGGEELWAELGISLPHAVAVVLSAVGIYLVFLVSVRVLGQRLLSAMSTFDVVITVMLGAVAGRVILGHPPTLASGVVGLATLFVLEVVFGSLGARDRWRRVLNTPARVLVVGERMDERALRTAHITRSELNGALRKAGVRSMSEVACVIHESGGGLSVLRRGVPLDPELLRDVAGADRIPPELTTPAGPVSTAPERPAARPGRAPWEPGTTGVGAGGEHRSNDRGPSREDKKFDH